MFGGLHVRVGVLWIVSKTCCLKDWGTTGLKVPRMERLSMCCVLKCRLELAQRAATSKYNNWSAAKQW